MERKRDELIGLLNEINVMEKTYDILRIVDPVNRRVLGYKGNKLIETDLICYHFWNTEKFCDNCISMQAYKENEVFIKLEYLKDKIYMVSAIPVTIANKTVIIELLKEVSKHLIILKNDNGVAVDLDTILSNADDLLFRDHLTGLFNRRFSDERLQVDIINNSLHKGNLSLIMADIDLFKNVNDTFGHLAGDFILRELSNILTSSIRRDKDWVARYGGEEFLICLPNTNKVKANEIAERMRKIIEAHTFVYKGSKIQLTTSFGVHTLEQDNGANIDTLIGFVDKNLYMAKNSGRNAVISS